MRGKLKYLVRWKGYMAEENTSERLENLEDVMNLVEYFEKEIREKEIRQVERRKVKGKERKIKIELNPEVEDFV